MRSLPVSIPQERMGEREREAVREHKFNVWRIRKRNCINQNKAEEQVVSDYVTITISIPPQFYFLDIFLQFLRLSKISGLQTFFLPNKLTLSVVYPHLLQTSSISHRICRQDITKGGRQMAETLCCADSCTIPV